MTDIEIDRRLALAIGYTADRVRTIAGWTDVYNKPFERLDGPYAEDEWQRFDHTNPTVIWPIAARFNLFPQQGESLNDFWFAGEIGPNERWSLCAATASAFAVIQYVEGQK